MSTMAEQVPRSTSTNDDRLAFRERFPQSQRSWITNTLLYVIRAGADTPFRVLAAVHETLTETIARARRWNHLSDTTQRTQYALNTLLEHHDEAYAFAEWCLAWERLTPAEKARERAVKSEPHIRTYMEQQPATDKQIAYIRALGFAGEVTSKAHASELIDRLRRGERVGDAS